VVNASEINGSNYRRFTFRQSPGDNNALGVVKFNLPNRWDIYLHDTPHKSDFPNRNRAKSSGCIRVEKPREMAQYILTQMEGRENFTREHIDSIITTHKTQYEGLHSKIPVHIVYLTAFQDSVGNHLRFIDDIYKRDPIMAARTPRESK
jgi:murein L,D-transpeptidase YcbB/YkuD